MMKTKNVLIGFLLCLMLLFTIRGATANINVTGGAITYDGNDTIHTFTDNDTFNISSGSLNVTVLIVAGGGAGGGDYDGGGGGAGGLIYNTSYIATGDIDVIIGSGGIDSNGYDSTFGVLTATGGGKGGTGYVGNPYGGNGGSGGGGAVNGAALYGTGGNATIGQGNDGGDASPVDYWVAGGGGGGAGTAGVTGSGVNGAGGYGIGGDGGNGTNYSINGSDVYYAGGGGAGTYTQTGAIAGKGGLGGGGNGSLSGAGDAGIANTGGGGGGRGNGAGVGGDGGNGIVIVRYPTASTNVSCTENWTCSLYEACNASSISPCLAVNDSNSCNTTFNGSLSDYDDSCVYLSPMYESSEGNVSEWKMFGRYLNHTAWDGMSYSTILGLNQASYTTGGKITSSPAVAFGYVYFASKDGIAYQVNASNVSQLIANLTVSTINPDGTRSSFAIVNISGNLYAYIGGGDGVVYQLDALNISHIIASFDTNQTFITASPSIGYVDGHYYLYIGDDHYYSDGYGMMYQLDAENVSILIANYSVSSSIYDTPAVTSEYVYFGSLSYDVYQNNASNISQNLAVFTTGYTVKSSPAVCGGYVYITSYDGYIYQLNATNISQVIHSYYEGNEIFSSIAIVGDYAYVGTKWTDEILQLNASNISQLIHSYSTGTGVGNFIHSSPSIANGMLYIVADNGKIYQLNANNVSQVITIFDTGFGYEYATISSPAVANGYIYIGMSDGKLYQLNANNISLPNNITSNCTPNWTCDIYSACLPNNTMPCQTIADLNFCGTNFTGNMSDYDMNCTYILPLVLNTTSQDFVEATADNMTKIIVGLGRIAVLLGVVLAGIGISYVIRKLLMKR